MTATQAAHGAAVLALVHFAVGLTSAAALVHQPPPAILLCAKAGDLLAAKPAFFNPHWIYDRFTWDPNASDSWSLRDAHGPFSKSKKVPVDAIGRIASAQVRLRQSAHWKKALLVCGLRAGKVVVTDLIVPRPIGHVRPGRQPGSGAY
jgi:hypothetical protein